MGPTVWELEGPMPILKSSKRLVFTIMIVGVVDEDRCPAGRARYARRDHFAMCIPLREGHPKV
jgi:hypothetical protein